MLYIYQRPGESVRPWQTTSKKLWTPPDRVKDGQYMIVISDADEYTSFITLKDCPPIFVSLRRSADGLRDEISLGIPDDIPGETAGQLAAAQIENALAAVESIPQEKRSRIVSAYGLKYAGDLGAGPRALRAYAVPEGKVLVSIFYEDLRDDFTLSRECAALAFISETEKMALAVAPELYAAAMFSAAAEVWKGETTKARKKLCVEFGIDMQTFLRKQ